MTISTQKWLKWVLPALLVFLIAPFTPKIDLICTRFFYHQEHFSSFKVYKLIYQYGVYPAFAVSFLALASLIASFFWESFKKNRLAFLFLTIAMLLGPGLLINLLFKGFCMRPRPIHLLEFGGTEFFRPFYHFTLAFPNTFKSFPSGHASMGFYFLNFILLGQRLKKALWVRIGYISTLLMGGALSLTRIAQGKHFFSDTLMSLCFIWYIALLSDWFVFDFLAKKNKLRYIKD